MDLQWLFNLIGGVATLIVAGYVRFVQGQLDNARQESAADRSAFTNFRIEVAKEYVRHEDLRRIEDALVRIEAKLDLKVDK